MGHFNDKLDWNCEFTLPGVVNAITEFSLSQLWSFHSWSLTLYDSFKEVSSSCDIRLHHPPKQLENSLGLHKSPHPALSRIHISSTQQESSRLT